MTGTGHSKRGLGEPAHTQAPESQHMHSPYTVRRIDASHVLLSDGWVVRDISWQPPLLSCPLAASVTTKSMTPQSPPFLPHEKGSKFRSENVKAHVKPTTRKPQDCPPLSRKPPHRRPLSDARLGKRLAQTRWNSFVGSPGSRLAKIMLPRSALGLSPDVV